MESCFEGGMLDPLKCSKLSIEEKRELVYRISKLPNASPEMLQSWSRQEILQILCVEMGKERKYTGLTKLKIIEQLLRIISEKKSVDLKDETDTDSQIEKSSKRQKKNDQYKFSIVNNGDSYLGSAIYCKNSACKAILSREDTFCKRCSCCICFKYDDNKDPSLWLFCSSEPPYDDYSSCGMSCHIECALRDEKCGIGRLDGCFYCKSCGKQNDLLGCLRKQFLIAKDTRRVDIMCYRVSLCRKLLSGTEKYKHLYGAVDDAVRKLEAELGPLTGLPVKTARGIVNRLASGSEVQRLCATALESIDTMLSSNAFQPLVVLMIDDSKSLKALNSMRFEDVCSTSVTVILDSKDPSLEKKVKYALWHRKACEKEYPNEPTCTLHPPSPRIFISGLSPSTDYIFKVVSFSGSKQLDTLEVSFTTPNAAEDSNTSKGERSQSPLTNCNSSLSNPSSEEDESNNIMPCLTLDNDHNIISGNLLDATNGTDSACVVDEEHNLEKIDSLPNSDALKLKNMQAIDIERVEDDIGSDTPNRADIETGLPITPCRMEISKPNKDPDNGSVKGDDPQVGSSSKKRSGPSGDSGRDFEHYVKVIRWLECEGHIEKNFRQKFLTWYGLRANPQEVRIVKAFMDTFYDDPASLAGQLVDTFSECVSSGKGADMVPSGFCLKLWH